MSQERIPEIRGLVDVGLTIGAIVTQETTKAAWNVSSGLVKFAGRQTMQNIQRFIEFTDAHSYQRGLAGQEKVEDHVTCDGAMSNFLQALVDNPNDSDSVGEHFNVLANKLQSVDEVSNGIRMGDSADSIIPMQYIAQEFVVQLASTAEEFGVPTETSNVWVETLRAHTGIEPEMQILLSEQDSLGRMIDTLRESP